MRDVRINSQIVKFIFTGFISNGVSYILFLFLVYIMHWEHKISATLLFIFSMLINYFVNKNWTFELKGLHLKTSLKFGLTYLTGYFINIVILALFVDKLRYAAGTVQFFAICVLVIYYFLLNKYFIFKQ